MKLIKEHQTWDLEEQHTPRSQAKHEILWLSWHTIMAEKIYLISMEEKKNLREIEGGRDALTYNSEWVWINDRLEWMTESRCTKSLMKL